MIFFLGYLLIPVNQTEGESGVLLQTAALRTEEVSDDLVVYRLTGS